MTHKITVPWVQCTKKNPCPQCGATHHCTLSTNGIMTKCTKPQDGAIPIKQKDGTTAYLRRVSECAGGGATAGRAHRPRPAAPKLKTRELERLNGQMQTARSARRLAAASRELGVSETALERMGVGFDAESGCLSFPMYNGHGTIVGIRLRRSNPRPGQHRYFCVSGSRNGMFIPSNYDPAPVAITADTAPLVVVMPEGPTDVAAALDLGLMAVGRFSNAGGQQDILALLTNAPGPVDLVLVADRDEPKFMDDGTPYCPGWEGAIAVAAAVFGHPKVSKLKVLMPPEGAKDLRQWLGGGGTASVLAHCIATDDLLTAESLKRKRHALQRLKKMTRQLLASKEALDARTALEMAKAALKGPRKPAA